MLCDQRERCVAGGYAGGIKPVKTCDIDPRWLLSRVNGGGEHFGWLDRFSVIRNRRSLEHNRFWSALWWAHGSYMMPPPAVAKQIHLRSILRARDHRIFVESGTYRGGTSAHMARFADQVVTVELGDDLAAEARRRFAGTNVTVIHGDSTVEIPKLAAACSSPPLIFLDGHFSAQDTAEGEEKEPSTTILRSLGAVAPLGSTIVIDDLRAFGSGILGNPELDVPVLAARETFPNALIRAGLDSIVIELPTSD